MVEKTRIMTVKILAGMIGGWVVVVFVKFVLQTFGLILWVDGLDKDGEEYNFGPKAGGWNLVLKW